MPTPITYAAKRLTGRSYRVTDGLCSELTIRYQVITPMLLVAPGLTDLTSFPAYGAAPSSSDVTGLTMALGMQMCDVDVAEDESGIKWTFSAVYRVPGVSASYTPLGSETEYTAKVTHGTKMVEVKSPWDFDKKPFVNSAGRPYDAPPPLRIPARVVTVEKRLKEWADVSGHSGTCNLSSVTVDHETFAAGTAVLEATCETTGDRKWPYTMRFTVEELINLDDQGENTGCRINLVNAGYEFLKEGTLTRALVEDEEGKLKASPTPVLLADDGSLLADGQPMTSKQYRLARETEWPDWVSA